MQREELGDRPGTPASETVLATDLVRQDHDASRCPAIVDVEPTEHARDRDRLGHVRDRQGSRWCALLDALVRSALCEVVLVSGKRVGKMLIIDEQHVVEQLAAYAPAAARPVRRRPWWRCAAVAPSMPGSDGASRRGGPPP